MTSKNMHTLDGTPEAGVAAGTLYLYLKKKEDMLISL
jgi:hypothetical protein